MRTMPRWTVDDNGDFRPLRATHAVLPAGTYEPVRIHGDVVLRPRDPLADELIAFPGSIAAEILTEIEAFWDRGNLYRRYGFLHRRGYLLFGAQGTGKTSIVQQVISTVVGQGHLVILCDDPDYLIEAMEGLRSVEPKRPVVCVFEDLDAIIECHGERSLLQWLDGTEQVDKVINLASTNYPENLDPRIVARPRRFDRLIEIGLATEAMRRAYLERKLGMEASTGEVGGLVSATEELPLAALAELIIAVKCHGASVDATIDRLRRMQQERPRSDEGLYAIVASNGQKRSSKKLKS